MAKRTFDILVVLLTAPLWLPLMALIAVFVGARLGTPVLFRQKRPGLRAEVYELVKFRTMTDARDKEGRLLPDAERLTAFGRWLRSTSLDELPELWNVIRGDMSLVGPRPLLIQYLDRYNLHHARRHEVRPGITGLAQVMGRNALTWDEKLDWDVRYVETRNFWLDLKILFLTMRAVLRREGISAPGGASMPEFNPTGQRESSAGIPAGRGEAESSRK